jgi:hypothetical protein
MPRLGEIEAQCFLSLGFASVQLALPEENLRAYALLLSAHFQGFCRDLYTECALVVVARVRPSLRVLFQSQFTAHRALDHGNPNIHNLRQDFERFGFRLDLAQADPANASRIAHLGQMNKWRNIAAHQGAAPAGLPPLTLADIQSWRNSCDGLADSLDAIMYNHLRRILRRSPWTP